MFGVGTAVSLAGTAAINLLCCAGISVLSCLDNVTHENERATRFVHMILLAVPVVISWIVQEPHISNYLSYITIGDKALDSVYGQVTCVKIMFGVMCNLLINCILMIGVDAESSRINIHQKSWLAKVSMLIISTIGCMFISISTTSTLSSIMFFASLIFMLMQILFFIDLSMTVAEVISGLYEEHTGLFNVVSVAWSLGSFAGGVVFYCFLFKESFWLTFILVLLSLISLFVTFWASKNVDDKVTVNVFSWTTMMLLTSASMYFSIIKHATLWEMLLIVLVLSSAVFKMRNEMYMYSVSIFYFILAVASAMFCMNIIGWVSFENTTPISSTYESSNTKMWVGVVTCFLSYIAYWILALLDTEVITLPEF